jgi:hypothetical protein
MTVFLFQISGMLRFLIFGNYYMGLCSVALCFETIYALKLPTLPITFFIIVFSATILFYTHAYIRVPLSSTNDRLLWYKEHSKTIILSQIFLSLIFLLATIQLLIDALPKLKQLSAHPIFISSAFIPIIALLYYGLHNGPFRKINLRRLALLKPFIIGVVWAGTVTLFPVVVSMLLQPNSLLPSGVFLHFLQNFIFVSLIAIMFDIKDYADDYNHHLKTLIVRIGLRNTIYRFLLPGILLNEILALALTPLSLTGIILSGIPNIAILWSALSLQRRHSIFFYLIVIDGLLLIKSFSGILHSVL